jgi:ABC-type phosphonate transport system ATPase subunit
VLTTEDRGRRNMDRGPRIGCWVLGVERLWRLDNQGCQTVCHDRVIGEVKAKVGEDASRHVRMYNCFARESRPDEARRGQTLRTRHQERERERERERRMPGLSLGDNL